MIHMYNEWQLHRMAIRAKQLDGLPYRWGHSDCFTVLNLVYNFAGLKSLDRSVVLSVLGEDQHASYSQISEIVNELTVPAPSYPPGSILILTSNDVTYGTALLVPGGVLCSSMPQVRFTKRYAIRKAARIVGSYLPKTHG